jgi:fermentation-respiration switch protein FrsA (DUF1100 family)
MPIETYPPAGTELLRLFAGEPGVPLEVVAGEPVPVAGAPAVLATELSYPVTADLRTVATLVTRAGGPTGGPGVVVAHGGTADGRHWFGPEAAELARRGCVVLLTATSLPEHGDAAASERALVTNVLIQRRGVDVLAGWAGADPDRLRFYGHSGGACQGAVLAAVEPRLDRLVLASGGAGTVTRLAAEQLRGPDGTTDATTDGYLAVLDRFEPARYVAVPGPRWLLFQHGREDATVPLAEGRRLYEHAAGHRTWRDYPCGHATTIDPDATRDRATFLTAPTPEI